MPDIAETESGTKADMAVVGESGPTADITPVSPPTLPDISGTDSETKADMAVVAESGPTAAITPMSPATLPDITGTDSETKADMSVVAESGPEADIPSVSPATLPEIPTISYYVRGVWITVLILVTVIAVRIFLCIKRSTKSFLKPNQTPESKLRKRLSRVSPQQSPAASSSHADKGRRQNNKDFICYKVWNNI